MKDDLLHEARVKDDDLLYEAVMSECDPTEDENGVTVCAAHAWFMAGIAPGGLCIEGRLIEAEAAIAQVRGMVEAALAAHDELEGTYATVSAKAILNSLNGDSDE